MMFSTPIAPTSSEIDATEAVNRVRMLKIWLKASSRLRRD